MTQVEANRAAALEFFKRAAGADPRFLELVAPDIEWTIATKSGADERSLIPWIGRTFHGREGVLEFVTTEFAEHNYEMLELRADSTVAEGDVVVVFGFWKYRARKTGKIAQSEFAARMEMRDGTIAKYFFFENTLAVALSFRRGGSWEVENQGTCWSWPCPEGLTAP